MPIATPHALATRHPPSRLVAAAVILAMVLVAVLGYRLLPKADVLVPPVENCRLEQQACAVALPGGGRLDVAIEPRPILGTRPLNVTVSVAGARAEKVEVDFAGVDMNMGQFRAALQAAGDGRYTGNITLPVCVTGSMLWRATVLVDTGRQVISVPFRFESRHL